MRRFAYQILSSVPAKLAGFAGFAITGWSAGDPNSFKSWWGWAMTPENIRLFGYVGLAVFAGYWILLWLLKPKDDLTPVGSSQATHGPQSPAFGSIGDNASVIVNIGSTGQEERPRKEKKVYKGWDADSVDGLNRALSGYSPLPDMHLVIVLKRVYKHLGGMPTSTEMRGIFIKRVDREIADTVSLRNLTVWGRYMDRPIARISKSTWDKGVFNHSKQSLSVVGDGIHPMVFTDLKFNKDEIDEIWPD